MRMSALAAFFITAASFTTATYAKAPPKADAARDALAVPNEPTERQTRAVALRYAGLSGELDPWSGRARLSNLIPTLELRATSTRRRDAQTEYREDQVRDANGDFYIDDARQDVDRLWREGDGLTLRARVDLGRVIFDPAELQSARLVEQLRARRARLGERVAQVYWARRRLIARLRLADPDELEERVDLLADVAQHTAELDALTGDWFTRSCEVER